MTVKSLVTKMTTKQQNLPVENNILTIARCCHLKGQNKGKDHILFQTLSQLEHSQITAMLKENLARRVKTKKKGCTGQR